MLNRSMPSTAGATISISPARVVDEAFLREVLPAMKNAIYNFYREYTRWRALFPGTCVPVLTLRADCSLFTSKPAHLSPYLPGAQGHYYASFVHEVAEETRGQDGVLVIDLGIKTLATGVNEQGRQVLSHRRVQGWSVVQ
jgi:hypothetical protein